MAHDVQGPLRVINPVATVLILGLLGLALAVGIAPNLNTRVVELGESAWPGYAAELRSDPVAPECSTEALETQLAACPAAGTEALAPADQGKDPFGDEDPFADGDDPFADGDDPFGDEDPFADGDDPFADGDDPFADGDDPFADGDDPFADEDDALADGDDPFAGADDPFATNGTKPSNCAALHNLAATCTERHERFSAISSRLTPSVRRFRAVELAVSDLAQFRYKKHLLVLLTLLGALSTTAHRMHIALRSPHSRLEHSVAQGAQLLAHLFLAVSCAHDWQVQTSSGAEAMQTELPVIWGAGFAALAVLNLWHLARPPDSLQPSPVSVVRLLMVVPLYAYMAIIAGLYFSGVEQHPSGQAIFLHKFIQIPTIYVGIGLYIWAGMMLSRTQVAPRFFDLLLPWKLPPAILAWLVIVLAALPTAYSGASGIFVIAAGGVIFERLRAAGTSPRMALAATAMSGSLGVVLRPCLVVVLVSVLNKQVTTEALFSRGLQVFALTAVLSFVAFWLWGRERIRMPDVGESLRGSLEALRPLLPYAALALGVLAIYAVVFKTTVNEHTAPLVLPAVLLALLLFDRAIARRDSPEIPAEARGVWPALTGATGESSHHIGALLMVMVCSVGLGGVVERSEAMSLVPTSFGSPFLTMVVLVAIMVLVGMTMDALGAVVLVSVTVASVAYDNGIDPVHFWMMVLVAFELGYLTPPVSLNHLLARQVIGEAAEVEAVDPKDGFFERHEHLIVPMIIMGTALLLVAFVPLAFY